MKPIQELIRVAFERLEKGIDRAFEPQLNPLRHLGDLGYFLYWIVAVSGIYLYIGFETSIARVYASVEYLTYSPWYLGGVVRSLHRYASDAMVLLMLVHIVREFGLDRFRGARWFTWFTGIPIIWLVYASGISGYWLVWDELAQYVAIATMEWLDWLGIFGEPIARNVLAPSAIDSRFFTLLIFMHIALPLILLFILWIHLQRITRPAYTPPKELAVGMLVALVALSLVKPAVSHPPADLGRVPTDLNLDWFYLTVYPLFEEWSFGAVWALLIGFSLVLSILPWLPPRRRVKTAVVDLDYCNGCGRCVADCPYAAVDLAPRSDGGPFDQEAVVDTELCVGCGICVGACPTSIAFRSDADLRTGIDLPSPSLKGLRERVNAASAAISGPARVMVFGCAHAADPRKFEGDGTGVVSLSCTAMLPPSFIDYVLSRDLADGVFITGCPGGECFNRFGVEWMNQRLAGERDPRLRERVPRNKIAVGWGSAADGPAVAGAIEAFRDRLGADARGDNGEKSRVPTIAPERVP